MTQLVYHKPVLIAEVIEYLNIQPDKVYLDVTFGSGGHTRAILEHEKTCSVIALDWDRRSLDTYGEPLKQEFGDRVQLLWGNFSLVKQILKKAKIKSVDGIIADFGTSQMHLIEREGFSVYRDTPLDMRMSPAHHRMTAADVVNTLTEKELREMFWHLGGEASGKQIARALVLHRKKRPIKTTGDLVAVVEEVKGKNKKKGIHVATKVFQALRIYVNQEIENIHAFLSVAPQLLNPEGRIVCISFHSIEDNLVKNFFRDFESNGILRVLTKRVVMPTQDEITDNPSSRSSRLRAAERI